MRINKKLCMWAMLACTLVFSVKLSADPVQAAEKTAISSADDLRAMENDPSGSYYLTTDIVVPEGMTLFNMNNKFTGTFDGKGHTLKNYKLDVTSSEFVCAALFTHADGAKFKDLKMTGVDIRVSSGDGGALAAALVASAGQSTFENIKVSGSVQANGGGSYDEGTGVTIGGLVGTGGKTFVKCQSSVNLTLDASSQYNPQVAAGLAGTGIFGVQRQVLKNCSYSGKINVKAVVSSMHDEDLALSVAGLVVGAQSMSGCKNSGTIKVNADGYTRVAGLANTVEKKVSDCKNSGKLAVTVNGGTKMEIGGIVGYTAGTVTKSANTGSITVTDKSNGDGQIGGIGGYVYKISQSYNKGAIKVTSAKSLGDGKAVGGLVGSVRDCRNNYNTGAVTLAGEGYAGGLAGQSDGYKERVIYNYSTGKIKGSKGAYCGNVIGRYDGPNAANPVRMSYDCYYTQSGKDVGSSGVDWHEWTAKNKKVSSITSKNCPKLSSKYWKYSSSAKRLILKNNPEK